jgi:D-sedoheptulose 7-phosphate isomerase
VSAGNLDVDATLAVAVASEHLAGVRETLEHLDLKTLNRIAEFICDADLAGRTVYCMGNGGSAAIATHLASDLIRLSMLPEAPRPLRVTSLNTNTSLMTACANDHGYDQMFVEQMRGLLAPGDVVVGISTSGASPNVLKAMIYARAQGATAVGLTGHGGDLLRDAADAAVVIASQNVQVIEDSAMVAAHALCLMVRARRAGVADQLA